ncbi:MAG TPA: hypothetical protein VL996_06185 [Methylocella sp.]|nr:hypothetical protein [Methylocella sp.]
MVLRLDVSEGAADMAKLFGIKIDAVHHTRRNNRLPPSGPSKRAGQKFAITVAAAPQ